MFISTTSGPAQLIAIKVLLVSAGTPEQAALVEVMERSGLVVTQARSGSAALRSSQMGHIDVVLVDLSLPDMSAFDLIAWFDRTLSGIIGLDRSEGEAERIAALEFGAHDVTTPEMTPREIVARIRAMYRRAHRQSAKEKVHYGALCIDFNRGLVTLYGQKLKFTAAEFSVLELLANHAGQIVSRNTLSETALRRPWRPDDRSVDQLVFAVRQKLPVDEDLGALIQTVRCGGYRMRLPDVTPAQKGLEIPLRMFEAELA